MAVDESYVVSYLNEDASPTGESTSGGGTPRGVLTRVELDVAYSSEKALNLEMLLMQVEDRSCDYYALPLEKEDISNESVQHVFEFDILSGILNSEVKELDSFIASLRMNIADIGENLSENLSHSVESEEFSAEIKEKLQDAEDSLKQSQDLVADIRTRSAKYERDLAFGTVAHAETDSNQLSPTNAKWKQQNMEQQRHYLQMLEKSLARELDLDKKLSDSRYTEEDLKLKLLYAEQEIYNLEDSTETILERMFESENAAELLLGISRELRGKLQMVQFHLNGSLLQGSEMRSKLEESTKKSYERSSTISGAEYDGLPVLQANSLKADLQEAQDTYSLASSEILSLKDKVSTLEHQLRESGALLQLREVSAKASEEQQSTSQTEHSEMENAICRLKEDILRLESRVECAETKCTLLTKTNLELNEQLGLLENNGTTKKANFLERKLKESDSQLEHARASVEAIEEQQGMLYSALNDMEQLIEDLKGKVSKAESRAENAESKCTLLTETNLELNEEMGFLRSRLECLEASLNQADDSKMATAKDIGIRTKYIAELVMKLALERERLQLQIRVLNEKNKILAKKCLKIKDQDPVNTSHKETENEKEFNIHQSPEDTLRETATTNFLVEESITTVSASERCIENNSSSEGSVGAVSSSETVRTIEATQLNSKSLVITVLVVLLSVLAIYVFQL
ncbi:WPP domain-interacting tail-anchored protein 1-like [Iris pallida]|uniref:WPP domain-interacting tail-anchored protein 1-like n=1 Tax=Iris pallida TaxID=29817 RepID=A0AAX6GSD0_IRIPA|nr:WPP domain-interacting tail-anchored protein 1-like [Iris pallida]KAJ6831442.1 WPP domain-interacting tail-anchored protein 1-like [Iris pallida]